MRGLKERYEVYHGVKITDGAIIAAAALSNRYITDRFLPDKAIDLVDEAASRKRLSAHTSPLDLKEIEEKIKAQSDKIDLAAGDAYSLEDDDDDELMEGDFEMGGDDDESGEMDLRILDVSADD